jgi:hypothetical protein
LANKDEDWWKPTAESHPAGDTQTIESMITTQLVEEPTTGIAGTTAGPSLPLQSMFAEAEPNQAATADAEIKMSNQVSDDAETIEEPEGAPPAEIPPREPSDDSPEAAQAEAQTQTALKAEKESEPTRPPARLVLIDDQGKPSGDQPETVRDAQKLRARSPGAPEPQSAKEVPSQPDEDWWATSPWSPQAKDETLPEQSVLKLKANKRPESHPAAPPEIGTPGPSEDWWTPQAGDNEALSREEHPVLKLKAQASDQTKTDEAAETEASSSTEDWWASPPES